MGQENSLTLAQWTTQSIIVHFHMPTCLEKITF